MDCSCTFENGKELVDRLREKNYSKDKLDINHEIKCECGNTFNMETLEDKCESCNMVYGVTPCKKDEAENIMVAGINY